MKHFDRSLILPLLFALVTTVGYLWFVLKITHVLEVVRDLVQR